MIRGMKPLLTAALLLFASVSSWAINPELLSKPWSARWIAAPGAGPGDYGVYHFRRAFTLPSKPASFVIHVTGDNRYQLYVNGERVCWGPARGDLYHWRYETADIARHLNAGNNVLAAVVWNYGTQGPVAQISNQTGFLLQGDTAAERMVDTGPQWKCVADKAYVPLPVDLGPIKFYYALGAGEAVDARLYPWGWEKPDFDDSRWAKAEAGRPGYPRDAQDSPTRWMLVPRPIPMMEETPQRLLRLRQANAVQPPATFPEKPASFQVPAHTKATLLLDQTYLTTAYPELTVSGGGGASISLGYAEAMWAPGANQKGNRNEIEGKEFRGNRDAFMTDGGAHRLYRPLWWRTYRYLQLSIATQDQPLTIEDLHGIYTGYPFQRRARLEAGVAAGVGPAGQAAGLPPEQLQRILDTGWRTARLCAHETYMDCPYYEQLQYVGDTRIQALVSLYMAGDARLMRNAIEQIDSSRTAEGATYSRAPSALQQYIPPFSLWWIGMVHDYWMYQDDPAFVRSMLPGVRAVLSFFAARQKSGGSLGRVPWWNFVDWVGQWPSGVPPMEADGSSAPLDLQLLLAYQWAARMEAELGSKGLSAEYDRAAADLREAIRLLYFDPARQLYADTPARNSFSQHTNALAVVAGLAAGEGARGLLERTLSDNSLAQCTIYFRHYLHSALNLAGLGDRYVEMLGEWRAMLDRGLTTWAEHADPVRSDCHAWGASPNYELFRTVLGIDSAAPGFRRVLVRPFLGPFQRVSGSIPHPKGEVAVSLVRRDGRLEAEVALPPGVTGDFTWHGQHRPLTAGNNKVQLGN
jgi:alpha-L-rhamnosidase